MGALGLTWLAKNEKPEVRAQLFRYHEQLGLLALGLAAPRLAVRLMTKSPAAMPGPMVEHLAAHAAHLGLYGLMFGVPVSGILMMWMSGTPLPIIGPLEFPGKKGPTEADQAFAKWSGDMHRLMGSVFEAFVAAHVAAAGYHIVMDHSPTARIVPFQLMHIVDHVDVMARTRPGPLAAGLGMAALGALWVGSVAKDLLPSLLGGDAAPAGAAPDGEGKWRQITPEEVEQHNKEDDLWIIIDGSVYDLTKYHKQHPAPAGPGVIIKNAGQDSSAPFRHAKHSPKAMELRDKFKVGELERNLKTELARIHNCDDMQDKAKNLLKEGALAYYDAGAEDRTSMTEALECWDRDWRLRPRNFIDVSTVDTGTTVLGHRLEVPIMAAPTALLKMGHEDGEAAVARGCQMTGVGNCLSTTASLSMEDVAAASPDCYRWFQLYVYKDHEMTKRLIQRADNAGYSAIVMTVDLPVLGNRTSLKRMGFSVPKEFKMANVVSEIEKSADLKKEAEAVAGKPKQEEKKDDGVSLSAPGDRAAYVNKLYDQSLTLELIPWIAEITDKPVVIKGILRGDSAALCAVFKNVEGVVVSNHGGRQLDNCLAPLTALPDVVNAVNQVNIERVKKGWKPVEVYVDGGIKRGRDVFKALALGAKAVMIGRPMIYGMAVGGELGVARTVEMLRDELKICMQLGGTQTVDQIDRTFVVRHGKEHDEALTLEAGSVEAKSAPQSTADILKISAKQDAAKAAAQIVTGEA